MDSKDKEDEGEEADYNGDHLEENTLTKKAQTKNKIYNSV